VNRWLVDRGDGRPAVNLVVLSFVNPLKMLHDTDTGGMIPQGMTQEVVDYFKSRGIRVMLSIGGIEIDYENSSSPNIGALEAFIAAYRLQLPYDAAGSDHAARLTIDVAAGDRWLIALNRYATEHWLPPEKQKLDYANAMVSGTSSGTPTDWQEHVDGKPQYAPPVPPLAPARFTGALYLKGNNANCLNYGASEQKADANYVRRVMPNASPRPRPPVHRWQLPGE
jgi:hypothetical protein